MPTATVKNNSKEMVVKKSKVAKNSVSKELADRFSDAPKKSTKIKSSPTKDLKTENLPVVEEAENSVTKKVEVLEKKAPQKKSEKSASVENISTSSIAAGGNKKSEEKASIFSSFFGSKKVKESDEKQIIQKPEDKISISEPVKATPVPMRKIDNEKKLSTFGLTKERDQFIENLSMLVLSGMTIIGAITSIIKQTKSPGMKLILERILLEIESGSPVWKALDKTSFFKGYTISLIRLGEESGNFAENLKVVALEEEKDREFKSKVRSALMYPIFVLGLTGIVGIGISWFILPKLAKIFYDLKLALPLITKVLLAFGLFLSKHGLIAVPVGAVVIGAIGYIVFGYKKTKFLGEAVIFSIPGIKMLLMEVEVARFGYLLGTLLEAGLPVTKAIDSLASATEVIRYKKFYIALRESIEMGNSFEKSFAAYKNINNLIPPPVQQLIVSGEQSGNLNKTLIKVGQVLEAKSDTTTKNLTIIMEPILLVIVWAGVVSVAFAVILPIYSLVGGLNNI